MTDETRTCPCGEPAPAAYLCRRCAKWLERDLHTIADLWPDTEVTLGNQSRFGAGGGGKSTGGGRLPYNPHASEIRDEVQAIVGSWLRDMANDTTPDGVTDVPSACQWLITYLSGCLLLPQVTDMADELGEQARALLRLVDRPADRVAAGTCDVCGQDVTMAPTDDDAVCRRCEVVIPVRQRRAVMLEAARDMWATDAEIVGALPVVLGMRVTQRTLDRWVRQRVLIRNDTQRLRVGDVLDQAEREAAKRSAHRQTDRVS